MRPSENFSSDRTNKVIDCENGAGSAKRRSGDLTERFPRYARAKDCQPENYADLDVHTGLDAIRHHKR